MAQGLLFGHRPGQSRIRGFLAASIVGFGMVSMLIMSTVDVRRKHWELAQKTIASNVEPELAEAISEKDSLMYGDSSIPISMNVISQSRDQTPRSKNSDGSSHYTALKSRKSLARHSHKNPYIRSQLLAVNSSVNASVLNATNATNATNANKTRPKFLGDTPEQRCALFGGLAHCPDWILLDSPCSPEHPCRDLSLEPRYVHPACQPSWTGRRRDGTRFYTRKDPGAAATASAVGGHRRRHRRRRGPSVDWYANGLPPSTTGAYPGRYKGGRLRWSPQPRPPYVHGYYPGTCEPDNYQGLWNGANETVFNNATGNRTCQCDLRCEARRDCCCDVNYWRSRGRWAVIRDGVDPGIA